MVSQHKALLELLKIDPVDVVFGNPFFQRKTHRQQGCQIDYMIQTRFNTVYICEIKFSKSEVRAFVVDEVQEKIRRLTLPQHFSYRPVLIHVNGVAEGVREAQFFSDVIDFGALLGARDDAG